MFDAEARAREVYAAFPRIGTASRQREIIAEAITAARRDALKEAAELCRETDRQTGGRGADGDDCAAAIERLRDEPA